MKNDFVWPISIVWLQLRWSQRKNTHDGTIFYHPTRILISLLLRPGPTIVLRKGAHPLTTEEDSEYAFLLDQRQREAYLDLMTQISFTSVSAFFWA